MLGGLVNRIKQKLTSIKHQYTPEFTPAQGLSLRHLIYLSTVWNFENLKVVGAKRRELFAFRTAEGLNRWTIKTDKSIGGNLIPIGF